MRKSFAIASLSLLALTACNLTGTTVDSDADSSAAASADAQASEGVSSTAASAGADATSFAAFEAWAPALVWSDALRGTNDSSITIDAEHVIPAGALQASYSATPITADQYLTIFQDGASRAALDEKMTADGWTALDTLDADGATGTQWGYTKTTDQGVQFAVVSATGTDCTGSPAVCTTYMAKVTVTDTLAEGDDL